MRSQTSVGTITSIRTCEVTCVVVADDVPTTGSHAGDDGVAGGSACDEFLFEPPLVDCVGDDRQATNPSQAAFAGGALVRRQLAVRIKARDLQRQALLREVLLHRGQLVHHAVIDELRVRQIDDHVFALHQSEILDLAAERNPIAEHGRLVGHDLAGFVVHVGHVEIGLERAS